MNETEFIDKIMPILVLKITNENENKITVNLMKNINCLFHMIDIKIKSGKQLNESLKFLKALSSKITYIAYNFFAVELKIDSFNKIYCLLELVENIFSYKFFSFIEPRWKELLYSFSKYNITDILNEKQKLINPDFNNLEYISENDIDYFKIVKIKKFLFI